MKGFPKPQKPRNQGEALQLAIAAFESAAAELERQAEASKNAADDLNEIIERLTDLSKARLQPWHFERLGWLFTTLGTLAPVMIGKAVRP